MKNNFPFTCIDNAKIILLFKEHIISGLHHILEKTHLYQVRKKKLCCQIIVGQHCTQLHYIKVHLPSSSLKM